ncbi:expressed unknown protein [Seminavis robusta]|uniref:F-box domain-containing protein n=1 Tax=Seminavis robusta TaxID=568900 RepID=A0A9N8E9S8_9STRA|nr:expressed unknown protein [Seminavis robusta]|eukprot:Sro855_g211400.1 n/a (181) ;mRNA; r:21517-22059
MSDPNVSLFSRIEAFSRQCCCRKTSPPQPLLPAVLQSDDLLRNILAFLPFEEQTSNLRLVSWKFKMTCQDLLEEKLFDINVVGYGKRKKMTRSSVNGSKWTFAAVGQTILVRARRAALMTPCGWRRVGVVRLTRNAPSTTTATPDAGSIAFPIDKQATGPTGTWTKLVSCCVPPTDMSQS